jgi:hypothetical protein
MAKNAAITVRVPLVLKRRLEARAKRERRSISAQVQLELERAVGEESSPARRPALGMFEGSGVPTDEDLREVRSLLFGRLGRRDV